MSADKPPRTRPDVPRPGGYRATLPSVREEHSPELLDAADEKEDTGLNSANSLVVRLEEKARTERALRERVAELEAAAKAPPPPPVPRVESDGVELSVRTKGVSWKAVALALPGLVAAVLAAVDKYNGQYAPKQPPVTPVVAAQSQVEARVSRLERCYAATVANDSADSEFVERALRELGATLPRREGDGPPHELTIEAQPLVNAQRGARPMFRITSTRPPRRASDCP